MSDLKEVLVDLIQKSETAVQQGVTWLSGQIPDVIHQLLMWKLAEQGLTIFFCLFPICLFIWSTFSYYKATPKVQYKYEGTFLAVIILSGCISILALGQLIFSIMNIVQILIAPKIYLLEYATRIIK